MKLILNFLIIVLFNTICKGQVLNSETQNLDSALAKAKNLYASNIRSNSHLLNGVEYKDYEFHNYDEGDPYYLSEDWELGNISYEGQIYENVYLQYNVVRDKVVLDHPYGHFKLELINEKIKSFSFRGHNFIKLLNDTLTSSLKSGFYDLLYDGNVKVLSKRRKEIIQTLNSRVIVTEYKPIDKFYILKNYQYYQVRSKSSVLKVFYDRKSIVRKRLSKEGIHFWRNQENAIVAAAKFYDESGK